MGMNGQPSFAATRGPKMKPRASGPATAVGSASATDSAKDSVRTVRLYSVQWNRKPKANQEM